MAVAPFFFQVLLAGWEGLPSGVARQSIVIEVFPNLVSQPPGDRAKTERENAEAMARRMAKELILSEFNRRPREKFHRPNWLFARGNTRSTSNSKKGQCAGLVAMSGSADPRRSKCLLQITLPPRSFPESGMLVCCELKLCERITQDRRRRSLINLTVLCRSWSVRGSLIGSQSNASF
jgi:hypothetical protein